MKIEGLGRHSHRGRQRAGKAARPARHLAGKGAQVAILRLFRRAPRRRWSRPRSGGFAIRADVSDPAEESRQPVARRGRLDSASRAPHRGELRKGYRQWRPRGPWRREGERLSIDTFERVLRKDEPVQKRHLHT